MFADPPSVRSSSLKLVLKVGTASTPEHEQPPPPPVAPLRFNMAAITEAETHRKEKKHKKKKKKDKERDKERHRQKKVGGHVCRWRQDSFRATGLSNHCVMWDSGVTREKASLRLDKLGTKIVLGVLLNVLYVTAGKY